MKIHHKAKPVAEGRANIDYVGDLIVLTFKSSYADGGFTVTLDMTEKEAIELSGYLQAMAADKIGRRRL